MIPLGRQDAPFTADRKAAVTGQQGSSMTRLSMRAPTSRTPGIAPLTMSSASKRLIDVVVSGILLVTLSPLLAAIWIATHLTSPGGALFAQTRLGRGGRAFRCLKFRTMTIDRQLTVAEAAAFRAQYKLEHDPRVMRLGGILRRLSLDELPQLVNVLRGDMSLVGPRPLVPAEYEEKWSGCAPEVLSVRPGMTGLWQVSGRSRVPYARRIELELEYVRRRRFSMDVVIVARTVGVVLRADGA